MDSTASRTTVLATNARQDAPPRSSGPRRVRAGWRWGLVLVGVLALVLAGVGPHVGAPGALGAAERAGAAGQMPSAATDGVLTMTIPRGAAADQQAGGRGYILPSVISLHVGDRVVIRNDDDAPHMFLYAWVRSGETVERTFTQPGSEVYSAGCGLHAASILNFTTIFVSA